MGKALRILIPLLPVYNHRLGVGYITAVLRARGHEVIPIDFEHLLRIHVEALSLRIQDETEVYADNWSEQIQYLHRPELLFGALFPEDFTLQRELNEMDWRLIAALRPHMQAWVEAIVRMEPDIVLMSTLVSNLWIVLWASKLIHESMPAVPRVLGGRVVSVPTDADLVDLDSLPFPDLSGLPFPGATLRCYSESGRDFHDAASMATSRWCPHHCAYCYESIYPKNYRLRKVLSVVQEIEFQNSILGTSRVFFCDSTLNVSSRWLGDLANQMGQLPFKPRVLFAHCEPRHLNKDLLERMRDAGFEKLNFGVESLDDRTLRRMNRNTTVEETEDTLVAAAAAGISLGLNFVANYPGETLEEFQHTLSEAKRFAERLRRVTEVSGAAVRFMVSQARIDPHSALFVFHDRFGVHVLDRALPVPAELGPLRPLLDRIALRWEGTLPKEERQTRFAIARPYLEGLSIPGTQSRVLPTLDSRSLLHPERIPSALQPLIPPQAAALSRESGAGP